jgi:hypothetical protein
MDLNSHKKGVLLLKQFDQKYPMLKDWGCYMYVNSDKYQIVYIGKTARKGPRSFRARLRENILSANTNFCRELSSRGIDIDVLYLKVASIISVIIDGIMIPEVGDRLLSRIEMALTCATGPVYNPHEPAHTSDNFEIYNIGNPDPLPKCLKMMEAQDCIKLKR